MVVPPLERNHFIKGDDDDDEALFSDGEGKDATESSSSSHQIPHKQASTSWEIDVHPPRRTASTRYKVRLAKSNDQHLAKTLPPPALVKKQSYHQYRMCDHHLHSHTFLITYVYNWRELIASWLFSVATAEAQHFMSRSI